MNRVYHPYWNWECYKAGMFNGVNGIRLEDGQKLYAEFLSDIPRFTAALDRVVREWPISCEQFLLNENINRIAFLGQASMCIDTSVSRAYRGGFMLLSNSQRAEANDTARRTLDAWLLSRSESEGGLF